jgi:uncharacterized protein (DUF952 family)
MILHLVSEAEWDAKPADQPYVPNTFAKDGFIHCTQGDDLLLQAANGFYKAVPGDFLVLVIDESKVKAPVKWEAPGVPAEPSGVPAEAPSPQPSAPHAAEAAKPSEPEPPAPAPKTIDPPPEVKAEYGAKFEPEAISPAPSLLRTSASQPAPQPPDIPAPSTPLFPHIYGPLNRDAIVEIRRAVRAPDGTFTGFASYQAGPGGIDLKSVSQAANELVDATGEFSEALSRYKDRLQARMDELDKNIKDKLS